MSQREWIVSGARLAATEPREYDGTQGIAFVFEHPSLVGEKSAKVFWMDTNATEKKKAYWRKTLTMLGFPPDGRSQEDWKNISQFVVGFVGDLVMELPDEKGGKPARERIKFINAEGEGAGSFAPPDADKVSMTAASLFGGLQGRLPMGDRPPAEPGAPVSGEPYDDDVPF